MPSALPHTVCVLSFDCTNLQPFTPLNPNGHSNPSQSSVAERTNSHFSGSRASSPRSPPPSATSPKSSLIGRSGIDRGEGSVVEGGLCHILHLAGRDLHLP